MDEHPEAKPPLPGFEVVRLQLAQVQRGDSMVVAIGNEGVRRRITTELRDAGCELPAVVHRLAYVSPDAELGYGVVVLAGAIVETGASVGDGAIIDVGAIVDHDASVAAFAHVRPGYVVAAYGEWPRESVQSADQEVTPELGPR
jgi:UDP-3-O-[3-hydroxymyristoyl] glucosamine N-acyltransferase